MGILVNYLSFGLALLSLAFLIPVKGTWVSYLYGCGPRPTASSLRTRDCETTLIETIECGWHPNRFHTANVVLRRGYEYLDIIFRKLLQGTNGTMLSQSVTTYYLSEIALIPGAMHATGATLLGSRFS
eukprot:354728-Amorphochlora_amoeboformis.AAC.1